jgi:hypothetical protein
VRDGSVDPAGRLPNNVWITESGICTDDAVASGAAGCMSAGTARSVREGFVDLDDRPPNIDRIIESASCVGLAVVVAGASTGVAV